MPNMNIGSKQDSALAPLAFLEKKMVRPAGSSASSKEEATRPKPAFRNSAQGSSGSQGTSRSPGKIHPAKKQKISKKNSLPPYYPEVNYAKKLAIEDAYKERTDVVKTDDNSGEKPKVNTLRCTDRNPTTR